MLIVKKTIASDTPHMEVKKIDGNMTIVIIIMNRKKSLLINISIKKRRLLKINSAKSFKGAISFKLSSHDAHLFFYSGREISGLLLRFDQCADQNERVLGCTLVLQDQEFGFYSRRVLGLLCGRL